MGVIYVILGAAGMFGVLALIGRATGKRGPNSKVPTKETVIAVTHRS